MSMVTREEKCSAASARQVAVAYCHGTPLRNEIEARDRDSLQLVTDVAAAAIEVRYGKGPVVAKICAHIIAATR